MLQLPLGTDIYIYIYIYIIVGQVIRTYSFSQRACNTLANFVYRAAVFLVPCRISLCASPARHCCCLLSKRYVFRYASTCLPFFFLQVILRLFISTDLSRFTPSLRCYVFRYFAHIDIMPVQNCLGFSINFNSLAFFTQVRFSKTLLALIVLATFSI